MFNTKAFEEYLATSWLGRSLYFFKELESTNTYAKNLETDSSLHGALVLAEYQTGGRGQYNRVWEANPGANLTFSLVFIPQKTDRFTLLTLACAQAIAAAAGEETGTDFKIKWPNDVLSREGKVSGLLTEAQFSGNNVEKLVIGIGMNVNQLHFSDDLKDKACSLSGISGRQHSREELLAQLLLRIEHNYRLWKQQDIELVKQVNRSLIGFGEWTQLRVNDKELDGEYKFLGVNESGSLMVLNKELEVNTFSYEQVRIQTNGETS